MGTAETSAPLGRDSGDRSGLAMYMSVCRAAMQAKESCCCRRKHHELLGASRALVLFPDQSTGPTNLSFFQVRRQPAGLLESPGRWQQRIPSRKCPTPILPHSTLLLRDICTPHTLTYLLLFLRHLQPCPPLRVPAENKLWQELFATFSLSSLLQVLSRSSSPPTVRLVAPNDWLAGRRLSVPCISRFLLRDLADVHSRLRAVASPRETKIAILGGFTRACIYPQLIAAKWLGGPQCRYKVCVRVICSKTPHPHAWSLSFSHVD